MYWFKTASTQITWYIWPSVYVKFDYIVIEKQALGVYYYKNSNFIIKMCCYCKYFFIDVAISLN